LIVTATAKIAAIPMSAVGRDSGLETDAEKRRNMTLPFGRTLAARVIDTYDIRTLYELHNQESEQGMRTRARWVKLVAFAILVLTLSAVRAQNHAGPPQEMREPPKIYSPYVERVAADANFAEGVYWGDTHLHTSYSTDAGMFGNTLGPDAAFRFARGEEVLSSHGLRARLIRPLDFLVVSDHAENLGLAPFIAESNPELLKSEWGRNVHDMVKSGNSREAFQTWLTSVTANADPTDNPKMMRTAWEREIAYADEYYEPGRFTSLIGFEWTFF
jgi:hypothetical protein